MKAEPTHRKHDGAPMYDRYTYQRFGGLYVQHYMDKTKLKAWCVCGNWTLVTTRYLDQKGDDACCDDCENPSPTLTRLINRMKNWKSDK